MTTKQLILLLLLCGLWGCNDSQPRLTLATTTSTYDSGLTDQILPDFEAKTGIQVDVIAVGTGEALALGRAGDVDVVLVHAREQEEQFVADGYGFGRQDVMCNDFVIVGDAADPANIAGQTDAVNAFTQIAQTKSLFLSRGDESGTHTREMMLWDAVGIDPTDKQWYQSIGQGMGALLTFTDEQDAYTLADRGTFLKRHALNLQVMVEGDARLFNPYGAIIVSNRPETQHQLATQLIDWLTSPTTQATITQHTVNGQPLFRTACDA